METTKALYFVEWSREYDGQIVSVFDIIKADNTDEVRRKLKDLRGDIKIHYIRRTNS